MAKVRYEHEYASKKETSIAAAVDRELDGRDYERGQIEAISETADNTTRAFGKLIEKLYDKNLLDKSDLTDFLGWGAEVID